LIKRDVNFGKGKIKGLAAISRKYWDEGKLTTNQDKILLSGKKSSFEIATKDIISVELVKHRTFKVIRITLHNDEFYHVSSIPEEFTMSADDVDDWITDIQADVEKKNLSLYNALHLFLNP